MPGTAPEATAKAVDSAVKSLAGNALILQNLAFSAQKQPHAGLGSPILAAYQTAINEALGIARQAVKAYLDTELPMAFQTITNFGGYFQTQNFLGESAQNGLDLQVAITQLTMVREQAAALREQATGLANDLQTVRGKLTRSATVMDTAANDLAVAVDGDNGVLTSVDSALSAADVKINAGVGKVVDSSLAVPGGRILLGVGALAEAITGGVPTAVVVGGVAIAAIDANAAAGGTGVSASMALADELDAKSNLIAERARLNAETTLAAGLSSGLKGLCSSVGRVEAAALSAVDAWTQVCDDLDNLRNELIKGVTTVLTIRELLADAAQGQVALAQADIDRIRTQMTEANPTVDLSVTAGALIRKQVQAAQSQ